MSGYANSHALVSTEFVEKHKDDLTIVLVEVDVDTSAYEKGHIPGAISWNWETQLCDPKCRDILSPSRLEKLLSESGIARDTTILLYGDSNNWFATWAFWQLKIYDHPDVRLVDGGRRKWIAEKRELTTRLPIPKKATYKSNSIHQELRAFLPQVRQAAKGRSGSLVDVRSPEEYRGEILAPEGVREFSLRGGHIPGAKNIPAEFACNDDGTFKSAPELKKLFKGRGVTPDNEVITYCRIGERSSHTWFVLKHLLGFPDVKNYDGSWTEWGNLVGVPIETGEEQA